ncbi:hypothetical protein E6H29_11840 [Candidatus Bathyarchaeota archaeon]|nr:MAG: hypothetical protein E6H29_11840 [Candidatus Bathyarchaeota archaeon]
MPIQTCLPPPKTFTESAADKHRSRRLIDVSSKQRARIGSKSVERARRRSNSTVTTVSNESFAVGKCQIYLGSRRFALANSTVTGSSEGAKISEGIGPTVS